MASSIARWNGIQWVIVSDTDDINSKLVIPPAEAGPRDDISTQARFGHISAHGSVGFMALPDGVNHIIMANAQPLVAWQRNAAGTGWDALGSLGAGAAGWVVGPAKMSLRADVPAANEAYFGHASQHGSVGLMCLPDGNNQLITAYNGQQRFYQRSSTGTGHDYHAYISATRTAFNGWAISQSHPVHGGSYAAIWRDGSDGGDRYTILSTVSETMLNALSSVYLRVSNSSVLTANSGSLSVHVPFYTGSLNANGLVQSNGDGTNTFYGNPGRGKIHSNNPVWAQCEINSGYWGNANLLAYGGNLAYGTRMCVHTAGIGAPQWRVSAWSGEAWEAVSQNADAWVNMICADAVEASALAWKTGVRSLRPEREYIGVCCEPYADVLEAPPDIMALRPVAYRRKRPMQRPVRVDPDGDPASEKTWASEDYEPDTVHGHETRRERLGLIADEVQYVIPSAVYRGDTGEVSGINYSQVTVALLDHVQELTRTVETLRYRVVELERGES